MMGEGMLGIWLQVSKWFHNWANYLKMKILTDQFLNVANNVTDILLDEQWIIAISMLGAWLHGFTSQVGTSQVGKWFYICPAQIPGLCSISDGVRSCAPSDIVTDASHQQ